MSDSCVSDGNLPHNSQAIYISVSRLRFFDLLSLISSPAYAMYFGDLFTAVSYNHTMKRH